MYRFLEYDPARRLPPVCTLYEKGISLSGLSKAFALPGLRLGWIASQDGQVIERCQAFKDYTTICNSAPSEILGIIALRSKDKILARNLKIIAANILFAQNFFARFPRFLTWIAPLAGSVAFPTWEGKSSADVFCQELLENKGVMIVPGSIFDYPGNHFRIGLGRSNLPAALEQLGSYLDRL